MDINFVLKLDDVSFLLVDTVNGRDQPIIDMGCEYQTYSVVKVGEQITIKACGWKIGVYRNTQQLYNFLQGASDKIET